MQQHAECLALGSLSIPATVFSAVYPREACHEKTRRTDCPRNGGREQSLQKLAVCKTLASQPAGFGDELLKRNHAY